MIYVQLSIDDKGFVNGLYTSRGNLIPQQDYPFIIQISKNELDSFIKRSHLFYFENEIFTDGNTSYELIAQHHDTLVQVYVVDPHGRVLETKNVKKEDAHNYVIEPIPDGMIAPQWNGNEWVSNQLPEKVPVEQENKITAMAIMELAEIILNGG